jgi:hypothetical protein
MLDPQLSTAIDPVALGGQADFGALADLAPGPAARHDQSNGLIFKLLSVAIVRIGRGSPLPS